MADYAQALERVLETLAPFAAAKGRERVVESSDLVGELGLSSIDVMEVIEHIEDEFDVSFPLNNLPNIRTAGDMAREIARLTDA
jgi:acyl carrier protein